MRECRHCGAVKDLHQYETMRCPRGGMEAPVGSIQDWQHTVFDEIVPTTSYKTLVWKHQNKFLCRYVVIMGQELYESDIPIIMPMTASMEALKKLNPWLDLDEVDMITVKLIDNV